MQCFLRSLLATFLLHLFAAVPAAPTRHYSVNVTFDNPYKPTVEVLDTGVTVTIAFQSASSASSTIFEVPLGERVPLGESTKLHCLTSV